MKTYEQKREALFERLINKQFEIAGHDLKLSDVMESKDWYTVNTITKSKQEVFKKYALADMKKTLKLPKTGKLSAESYFAMFNLQYGLREVEDQKCDICGGILTLVRPGKYQCDNKKCGK